MLRLAIDTHAITSHHALPLLIREPGGLVVEVTDGTADYNARYRRDVGFFYDLAKSAVIRMALAQSEEIASYGATALSLTPGWLRSEAMLDHFGVTEDTWRDATEKVPHFAISESPVYVGRAVAALAADPDRARWNGASCPAAGSRRSTGSPTPTAAVPTPGATSSRSRTRTFPPTSPATGSRTGAQARRPVQLREPGGGTRHALPQLRRGEHLDLGAEPHQLGLRDDRRLHGQGRHHPAPLVGGGLLGRPAGGVRLDGVPQAAHPGRAQPHGDLLAQQRAHEHAACSPQCAARSKLSSRAKRSPAAARR